MCGCQISYKDRTFQSVAPDLAHSVDDLLMDEAFGNYFYVFFFSICVIIFMHTYFFFSVLIVVVVAYDGFKTRKYSLIL